MLGALGASYLTLHAAGGVPMLHAGVEGLAEGAAGAGLDAPVALAVTILTSDGGAPPHVLGKRVAAALDARCGGLVCAADDVRGQAARSAPHHRRAWDPTRGNVGPRPGPGGHAARRPRGRRRCARDRQGGDGCQGPPASSPRPGRLSLLGAALDHAVLEFVLRHRQPWLTSVMRVATQLGSAAVLIPLVVVVGGLLAWRRRQWDPLLALAAAFVGGAAVANLLKVLTVRHRPPPGIAIGHYAAAMPSRRGATRAAAFWLALRRPAGARTGSRRVRRALWASAELGRPFLVGGRRACISPPTGPPTCLARLGPGWAVGRRRGRSRQIATGPARRPRSLRSARCSDGLGPGRGPVRLSWRAGGERGRPCPDRTGTGANKALAGRFRDGDRHGRRRLPGSAAERPEDQVAGACRRARAARRRNSPSSSQRAEQFAQLGATIRELGKVAERVEVVGDALGDVGTLHLDRHFASVAQRGAVHLTERGGRKRFVVEARERIRHTYAEIFLDDPFDVSERERFHRSLAAVSTPRGMAPERGRRASTATDQLGVRRAGVLRGRVPGPRRGPGRLSRAVAHHGRARHRARCSQRGRRVRTSATGRR